MEFLINRMNDTKTNKKFLDNMNSRSSRKAPTACRPLPIDTERVIHPDDRGR